MTHPWEYAVVTQDDEQERIDVKYAGPDQVAHHDAHKGALDLMLGAMGGKQWELVSVNSPGRPDSNCITLFFKRPHDAHNRGAEELRELARSASWSAEMAKGKL